MKKLTLAVAVASAIGAGPVLAYEDIAAFDEAVLVAPVYHDGATETTAIGFQTADCDFSSDKKLNGLPAAAVYWTWFDANSVHRKDRSFLMTAEDVHGFIWAAESGQGFEGEMGYLFAAIDTNHNGKIDSGDGNCLMASAFHVDLERNDVVHVPVINVEHWNVSTDNGGSVMLGALNDRSIRSLSRGLQDGWTAYPRYLINLAEEGIGTEITVWSAGDLTLASPITIYQYDTDEHSTSLTWEPKYKELNVIDVESLQGLDTSYDDGFLKIGLPTLSDIKSDGSKYDNDEDYIVWSKVWDYVVFGAIQTIYAAHDDLD